ncbi:DNA polymerase III subunit beta [Spiroplasma endosymbiont of Agriotes lineatus]|uniref:DNA polymerase III subunit beta n=1 Tax=Spiroplasma endosymbiont of Agriotes lineatus TaxID=3077930 RepID=UPI0030D58836
MIITISRTRLLNEINKISRIISYKSPLPALTGLLFEVKPDKLILIGSSGTLSIQVEIKVNESKLQIEEIGKTLIKVRFVSEVIRKIESDIIRIEVVEGSVIRINANNFDSQLNTLDFNQYPKILFDTKGQEFIISNAILKAIVSQVGFAIGEQERNIIFTGIHFLFSKGKLKVTATDSFRLASKEINFPYYSENDYEVIIPGKVIQEVNKISEKNNDVIIIVNKINIVFKINNTILQSKIIDGKYPNINKIIPESYNSKIVINNRDLLNAIDRASVLSHEISNTTIKLNISNDKINVEASSSEIGNSNENLSKFQLSGDAMNIAFRSQYMIDAIRAFKTNDLNINLTAEDKPIIITSDEDPTLLQLVLPMRTY